MRDDLLHPRNAMALWTALADRYGRRGADSPAFTVVGPTPAHQVRAILREPPDQPGPVADAVSAAVRGADSPTPPLIEDPFGRLELAGHGFGVKYRMPVMLRPPGPDPTTGHVPGDATAGPDAAEAGDQPVRSRGGHRRGLSAAGQAARGVVAGGGARRTGVADVGGVPGRGRGGGRVHVRRRGRGRAVPACHPAGAAWPGRRGGAGGRDAAGASGTGDDADRNRRRYAAVCPFGLPYGVPGRVVGSYPGRA